MSMRRVVMTTCRNWNLGMNLGPSLGPCCVLEKGGKSDLVTGRCYFGTSADSEWVQDGRYSLLREEEADAVVDTVAVEGGADEEA